MLFVKGSLLIKRLMNEIRSAEGFVTGPEKTGLIYIKYTYSYYCVYLSFFTFYLNSVNFNEQLRIFCTCD